MENLPFEDVRRVASLSLPSLAPKPGSPGGFEWFSLVQR
jgi:hypothetical protein